MRGGTSSKKTLPLKVLVTKLKEVQSSLDRICQFVDRYKEGTTFGEVEVRLERMDDLLEKFGDTLIEIKSHDDFDSTDGTYDEERKEFDERFYEVKSFLKDKMREFPKPPMNNQAVKSEDNPMPHPPEHVRLPQIRLQTFNGDIEEWISFRDLFTSVIHLKADLPEVEKLHYLKGCLVGEPKNLIDPLQITKANYHIAWEMLLKRYNDSKQLRKRQVQSLFSLPTITKESITELHNLLESFERTVKTLDQIIQPEEYRDLLLVNILTSRLDTVTRRGWEEFTANKEQDTVSDLAEFIRRRIHVLESMPVRPISHIQQLVTKPKAAGVKASFSTATAIRCIACTSNHLLHQCATFLQMNVSDREALLRTHALCRNCFRTGHQARDCQSKFSCRKCKGRHHTLVCFKSEKDGGTRASNGGKVSSSNNSKESKDSTGSSQVASLAATHIMVSGTTQQYSSQVLLATAVVLLEDDDGNQYAARALLDSGSESNFLSERLSQLLKSHRDKVDISILGIGQTTTRVKQRIYATVRSRVSEFSRELNFLVLPRVTVNLPTANVNTAGWKIPEGVELADPSFCVSKGVDIVLGIESFFDFFETGRKISLGENLPSLNESVFGWIVCGGLSAVNQSLRINCNLSTAENLEELVARFWSCEEVGTSKEFSPEEARCESFYASTVLREIDGRFSVSLPKNGDVLAQLGESRDIALRRLHGTERRLARDSGLREQYTAFMAEYQQLGHMRKITGEELNAGRRCYLPHHPVIKETSTTTKVRVVFDASCKTNSGVSLNDCLMVGPIIQDDLRSIILRCRIKQIMLVADVEKMFRQINVRQEDRLLQCILWREAPSEEVAVYELNTVTYGTRSAPFLATRTLKQLAMEERQRFPLAAQAVSEDTYMDDVLTGTNNVDEACRLRIELEEMMETGGFILRKWASNHPDVLRGVPGPNLAIPDATGILMDSYPSVKTLGLIWVPEEDKFKFQFSIPAVESSEVLTKRIVLSRIATLFDPEGDIGPVITTAKVYMQTLWTLDDHNGNRLGWDQPLPVTVGENWRKYQRQLHLLNHIEFDRCVVIPNAVAVQVHCFSDASQKAYGACIYIRSQDEENNIRVRLLTSKSKVAPLKVQTIPRLELCGALLGAELFQKVQNALKIPTEAFFWTDSTCVLRWLQSPPVAWVTFIANRVSKIQAVTENYHWRHVPGIENPADLISRGLMPSEILNNSLWWNGPNWLAMDTDNWPSLPDPILCEDGNVEMRRFIATAVACPEADFNEMFFTKFTSYSPMIRSTAIYRRFIKLLHKKEPPIKGFITTSELREAEITLVRCVQREAFAEELKSLANGKAVQGKSPLRWFNPFISEDQLLRIGGRLKHSKESEETKHPMALPGKHRFTRLLLRHYHDKLLHAGAQLLLGTCRLRFWPLGGRSVVRHIIHQCRTCFRVNPRATQQFMGELPSPRVIAARPFIKSGVDYFGPVYIRPGPRRTAVKAYVALFVCLCTKAVHLELASDLSTERFLQALRRFIGRRGRCTDIYSDNGTNFVGARNQLKELLTMLRDRYHHEAVHKECAAEGINWHFNPPSAPHFGGLWEAAVRSAKYHLVRVIGNHPVSIEDMQTLLVQAEACLNSRPMTRLSDDPNDLEPLTPAHFLTGASIHLLPDQDLQAVPVNRLKNWQLIQRRLQDFWRRWHREYLSQLQGRSKRWRTPVKIEIGKLVVLCDDNQPPTRWKMARIQDVHPGIDGVIRVVTVKTATGLLKRPVEKICLMPDPDYEE